MSTHQGAAMFFSSPIVALHRERSRRDAKGHSADVMGGAFV